MTSLPERFEVISELGRGAATRVFLVRDRAYGLARALKLASTRGQLRRFRGEYYRLCELSHPHIVGAHDFGLDDTGLPFYTMDYAPGVALCELCCGLDGRRISMIALQILDALSVLHARGLLHRDLKPQNLLVANLEHTPTVTLIDLGLAVRVGAKARAAGTLPYVAPEVLRGEAADGRADLYALGALLYELLVPESAARTLGEVAARLDTPPVAPHHLNPLVHAGLSDFVARMLAPRPVDRYADASEAAAALAALTDLELRYGPPRLLVERLLHAGAVSHRKAVRTRLHRAARALERGGQGGVFCMEAAVGAGKTPVLRELSVLSNLEGLRVLRLQASSEPLSPLPAMARAAHALCGEAPAWPSGILELLPAERGVCLLRFAKDLARALSLRPTVVLLDDLQECEPLVLEALAAFCRAAKDKPLLVVAASEARENGPSLMALLGPEAAALMLRPLSPVQVARLVAHRLWGLRLPAPALARLVQDSQGMPSLLERTLAHLVIDHTVERRGRGWVFVGGRYRPADHSPAALTGVGEATRQVLSAAVVLGAHLTTRRVARVASVSEEEARAALAELMRLEILDAREAVPEPRYDFASRATRAAIYQAIPLKVRRALHDRAAELLLCEGGAQDAAARWQHVMRGSDGERAVAAATVQAENAAARRSDKAAVAFYLEAYARLQGARDGRVMAIALSLGKLCLRGGELEQATSWFREAVALERGTIAAHLGLGTAQLLRGEIDEAAGSVARARELMSMTKLEEAELQDSAARLEARLLAARGDSLRGEQALRAVLASAHTRATADARTEVLVELARVAEGRGALAAAVRHARCAWQEAKARGDLGSMAEASVVLGRGLIRGGRYATARRTLARGLGVAQKNQDKLREAQLVRQLGHVELRQGELDLALLRYTTALELARGLGARIEEVATLRDIGSLRARRGELQPALLALHAAMEVASGGGDVHGGAYTALELAHAYAELGQHRAVVTFVDRCRELGGVLRDSVLDAETTVLAAFGLERAREVCESVLGNIAAIEDLGQRARPLWCAGRYAAYAGETDVLMRITRRLGRELAAADRRDYLPAWRVLLGHAALAAGQDEQADALFTAAATDAATAKLRPVELEARTCLAKVHRGSARALEEATRAMELAREVASTISLELLDAYLGREDLTLLRAEFEAAAGSCSVADF